ncbi:hypothetical protein CHY08_18260 [Rhizobium leguminosarum bv. viciae]|uniref:hypothetical protein n=1 Tax=Rhizobium leguminosarum TaxID=384 RepID=UPI000B8CB343|nr:hypothetical protein [Rhizobium leguminosarum]ASR08881.1 hypothetical protein CHY08_18260 [Rhizobium leguminosarum bv. viciae]
MASTEAIGYSTARLVLPIITLGKVRVQSITSAERGFNWLGFKRNRDGSLICQGPMAGLIGLLLWTLAIIFIVRFA